MNGSWKKDYLRYKDFFLNVLVAYKTKPNLRIYLELTLSIITVMVFAMFAIRPTILTIIDLNKEIKAKEETSKKLKQKVTNLQTASALMQQKSADIQYIYMAVPATGKPEQLISQIESLAINNSLKMVSFSTSEVLMVGKDLQVKKTKDFKGLSNNANELPFSVSLRGSYVDMYSFLNQIENVKRPIKIDSFVINSNVTDEGKILTLSVSGRVPYLLKE